MSTSSTKKLSLSDSTKPTLDPAPRLPPQLFQPSSSSVDSLPTSSSSSAPKPLHGNYPNYYERRNAQNPFKKDERLSIIPSEWLKGKKVLDVGCNAGQVTIELARDYQVSKITGVDIDKDLIRKAKGNLDLAWSRQKPLKRLLDESTALSTSSRKRRSRSTSSPPLSPLPKSPSDPSPFVSTDPNYFPTSPAKMFGYLPKAGGSGGGSLVSYSLSLPTQETSTTTTTTNGKKGKKVSSSTIEVKGFPENIKFVTGDWVNEEIESDRESYDMIFAFSVTKWIHLQSLNPGLLTFFQKTFKLLSPGGKLILEPQPFSTYSRSAKTSPILKENFELLKSGAQKGWRWEDGEFERVLLELVGFEKKELLGETGKVGSTFRRPVEVYTKRGGTTMATL